MAKNQKDPTQEKIDTAIELIKDLLIAQLAAMDFGNDQIKKVIGKIDNNRLRRIVAVHNKIIRQKVKQNQEPHPKGMGYEEGWTDGLTAIV